MARHRFSRANGNFGGVFAEDLLNRAGLANIADIGRGCMGVDVINLAGRNTCMFERQLHSACRTFAVWWRRGHVIGVRRKSVAGKFTVYLGAPAFACSSSSTTKIPSPSLLAKPSPSPS